jgi:hypothetical protein
VTLVPDDLAGAIDDGLLRRLWRRAEQPGVTAPRQASTILDRNLGMTAGLPLAERLARRAVVAADEGLAAGPIVYAHALPLPDPMAEPGSPTPADGSPSRPVVTAQSVPTAPADRPALPRPAGSGPAGANGNGAALRPAVTAPLARLDPPPPGRPLIVQRKVDPAAPPPPALLPLAAGPTLDQPPERLPPARPALDAGEPTQAVVGPPAAERPVVTALAPTAIPADTSGPGLPLVTAISFGRSPPTTTTTNGHRPVVAERPVLDRLPAALARSPLPLATGSASAAVGGVRPGPAGGPVLGNRGPQPGAVVPASATSPMAAPTTTPTTTPTATPAATPTTARPGQQRDGRRDAAAPIDIERIVDRVHRRFLQRLAIEGERRGVR